MLTRVHTGSLRQRENNTTGATEWVFFLSAGKQPDPKSTFWFNFRLGQRWPESTDAEIMRALIQARRGLAIKFVALDDALEFVRLLYPAEVGSDEKGSVAA